MRYSFRILTITLVSFLALLLSVLTTLIRAESFNQAVGEYPTNSATFTITNVAAADNQRIANLLYTKTVESGGVLVRSDTKISKIDGSASGVTLGVFAAPGSENKHPTLYFMGAEIITPQQLADLVSAPKHKTLGLDEVAADMIHPLPQFAFAKNLVVYKLQDLIEQTQTVNGKYKIAGLEGAEQTEFVDAVAAEIGVSAEQLISPLQGERVDASLVLFFTVAAIVATILLLYLVLLIQVINLGKTLGAHLLMGWSKTDFVFYNFKFLSFSLVPITVISFAVLLFTAQPLVLTPQTLVQVLYPICAVIVIVCLTLLAAMFALRSVKPIHALRGFSPKKFLLTLLLGVYTATTCGLYAAAAYLDTPAKEIASLAEVETLWQEVGEKQIYYDASVGSDSANFTGQSKSYFNDFYRWYQSIEDKPGVSLFNSYYVSPELLQNWQTLDTPVPTEPIWYFVASPSYLAEQNIKVAPELISRAQNGERIYLISDAIGSANRSQITAWLAADSERKARAEQEIKTPFLVTQHVDFVDIHLESEMFTWNTDLEQEFKTVNAVILLATTANMTYAETESLPATGLTNSYVKLSPEAAAEYLSPGYLVAYALDDNQPTFIPVSSFVAGLKKSISEYFQFFGSVTALMGTFVILALAAVVKIFSLMHSYKIAVLQLLGHSAAKTFAVLYLVALVFNLCALVILLLAGSTFGTISAIAMLLGQLITIFFLSRRYANRNVTSVIKTA